MEPHFGRDEFVKKPKGAPCPALVWFIIGRANEWLEAPVQPLRTIARSPTPFKLKNPELKQALERLGLEWLSPSQISRIRECPAPSYRVIRDLYDRWSSFREPREPAPRCRKFFWAWRADQKTCDLHLEYASMFRVQKHRKAKHEHIRKARQLKDARHQLKRARRQRRREKRQEERMAQSWTRFRAFNQRQILNDRTDMWLLQKIRAGSLDRVDPAHLEAMIRGGYVVLNTESQTYKLSSTGFQRIGELRKRVIRGPFIDQEGQS